jgi:enoyl-CoA hydratase
MTKVVDTKVQDGIGVITLQRGGALNALTIEMAEIMTSALQDWKADPAIHVVVIQSADPKAFSSGGDIKAVYNEIQQKNFGHVGRFYQTAYALGSLIANYPKPCLSLLHGIAMGGGLGVAMHSKFRVVAEDAVMAMPETAIGFFPDMGSSIFLRTCPGKLGLFLALTGYHFNAADALYAGLATHYMPKDYFPIVIEALMRAPTNQYATEIVGDLLEHFSLPELPMESDLHKHRELIDAACQKPTLQGFLEEWDMQPKGWGRGVAQQLEYAAPTSLAVTYHLFKNLAPKLSSQQLFDLDFPLSQKFVHGHDFPEGVRALLIDKDKNPHWQPAKLEDVFEEQVLKYFS